jgi:hypothetical protein
MRETVNQSIVKEEENFIVELFSPSFSWLLPLDMNKRICESNLNLISAALTFAAILANEY